jgi:16S rRNA (cytidine1402-2'-O)-methyltransferase
VLYVLATPIGNLGDFSERAKSTLLTVDAIACEDTRVTGKLLAHFSVSKPMVSYREENELRLAPELADRIAAGESIALISDAGTPCLNDPGFRLVRECRKRGLPVTGIPGPMAAVHALSISGLPSHAFFFAGFLPPKTHGRKQFFEQHQQLEATIIVYESCHRIDKALIDLVDTLGPDRCIAVMRELTKFHEKVHVGKAQRVKERILSEPMKGEFVMLIAPEGYEL